MTSRTPHDLDEALALLARVHTYPSGAAYRAEYPGVFEGTGRLWVYRDGDAGPVLSCAAAVPGRLDGGEAPLSVARVGSVATAPEARGRGLASTLLSEIHDHLRASGAALAWLWAERPGLYGKLGYAPVGSSWLIPAPVAAPPGLRPGLVVRRWREGDPLVPHHHGPRLAREGTLTHALLTMPGVEGWVGERGGEIVAHAVLGKGRDMQGIVHDWAGGVEDLRVLLHTIQGAHPEGIALLAPAAHPLLPTLRAGGMALPVVWMATLDRGALIGWARGLGVEGPLEELAEGPLLWRIFGEPPQGRTVGAPGALPFFVWGLDSL